MNERKKNKRARNEARQEKQAKKVINWICGVLLILAIAFCVYSMFLVS